MKKIVNFVLISFSVIFGLWISVPAVADDDSQTQASAVQPTHHTSSKKEATETVDINTADADALTSLKGVGEKKAQAIIDYRTNHGSFNSVNDLANVKGIGAKRLAALLKNNEGRITAGSK